MYLSQYSAVLKAKSLGYVNLFDMYEQTKTMTCKEFGDKHKDKGMSTLTIERLLQASRIAFC